MQKEPKNPTFDDFADELMLEHQPRALIILASAKVDAQLRSILERFLHPKAAKEKDPDELFDGETPLSTFSSKTKICLRLGIFDADLGRTLDTLRKIRNQAAHWVSFGIGAAPLCDQLNNLQDLVTARQSFKLTVRRFFGDAKLDGIEMLQAVLLTLCVLLETINERMPKRSLPMMQKRIKLN
jgi:hypothetical protein